MIITRKKPVSDPGVDEIKAHVSNLLNAAGVGNQLPTPKDDILKCAKLVEFGLLNLEEYKDTWSQNQWRSIRKVLASGLTKVKGFLHFESGLVYVDPQSHPAAVPFITYHEVIHKILPSHKILQNPHYDTQYTLDPKFAKGLEKEANIGAALILFQVDRFANEARQMSFGLESALSLAKQYGASCHASFRHYVETSSNPCALLILKTLKDVEGGYELWYSVESNKFYGKFGSIEWPMFYTDGELFDFISESSSVVSMNSIVLNDQYGFDVQCTLEAFKSPYNVFLLCYPTQRKAKRKRFKSR